MAFNFQTFRTRALTAIVFVVVMLGGLLWNQWSFLLLFSVIHVGCWIEYISLIGKIDSRYQSISPIHKAGAIIAGLGFMFWMTDDQYTIGNIFLREVGGWILVISLAGLILLKLIKARMPDWKIIGYTVGGLLYISLSWGLLTDLYNEVTSPQFANSGWLLPILIIATIWINDTMAYIVGSFIGKTPFSPISPKKTWEGTIGGAILAVLAVTLVAVYWLELDATQMIIITVTAAVMGTLGDLFESKLKRMAGVKDSGSFMPGHGGFLDRFDSLLLAIPYVWLLLFLLR
ncbi:phosphatidate cytidylyltransferase [Sediminibacterium sp.]|uniref:phosphatidate cytidylyltransferase n=1 Tax=Sediminibacterium sp. TaxID=1917865 RepID=UPI0025FB8642|nr:phosphatidate cytidylyltransferase [Sediminibacterium sp.]MBW0177203.1 phosphatidate cytidylyltransferase [Sediminibacterium sp.]